MTMRRVGQLRRAGAAAVLAAALAVSVTACNSESDAGKPSKTASSSANGESDKSGQNDGGKTLPDTSKVLATLNGEEGIAMVVHEAKRDSGGFLTISGEFKNTSGKSFTTPVQWSGDESAIRKTGSSLAAMTLVDSKGRKRYFVLRDTENRPLTTTKYGSSIRAGETLPFFAQFPAPPESTTTVDLQFPGFPNAPIEIS
ncbi:hypothetical protein [Streptomyces sp. NPDC058731]|uniref:hypothetical protein n=1 Tax=Streptomyces sp. NPDC058731 TaxID=3346613 RepID=UPI003680EAE4